MNPIDPSILISNTAAAVAGAPMAAKPPRRKHESGTEVRLGRGYEKMVQQALASDPSDSTAVDRARDALHAQELDTIEAARKAAEHITKYGI